MPRRSMQRWQPQSPKSEAFCVSEGAAQLHPNADRGVLTWLCSSSGRGLCCDGRGFFSRRTTATRVQQAENGGNEEQRAEGRDQQTADDRAPERSILLAAVAQGERHRQHADDHCQSGHEYRTKAREARLESRGIGLIALAQLLAREADEQNAVRR